ncbi:Synaptotagmin-2, partial [Dichanthelium oligosanthes]
LALSCFLLLLVSACDLRSLTWFWCCFLLSFLAAPARVAGFRGRAYMGFLSTVLGFFGFGVGLTLGLVIGYYLFIYVQPTDVKHPVIRPLVELDTKSLESMLPEIPLWVKSPDFDRIDWLNKFIETMWPYLDKAICKMVKEITKPIIAENTAKYKIDSVEFETLTLGSLPPTFQGMKVYTTDEQELIMEPSVKWAGNPNITVVVKAYGLKGTAQVVDLQVFALPRITLKPLVPSFPCFAKILVSLMEKPHVDFGLKILGADLMALPGLYGFVQLNPVFQIIHEYIVNASLLYPKKFTHHAWILQETIKTQVANMYLWPKVLEVQIMDPAKAHKKPVGILFVNVVRAVKLTKKDLIGKSDPYVKLKLTEDKLPSKKTSVKRSNLNPEWNEEFKLVVKDPESQALELTVYDWEQVGKHDRIGMNVIPLKDLTSDETKSITVNLLKSMDTNDPANEKFRGQLTVDVIYKPFKEGDSDVETSDESGVIEKAPDGTPEGGGLLVVIVHEAQDVEGKHHTNPYVRILFKGEEKKTKHIKKNRDPRWEQEFEFVCEEPPINEKMHVEVISRPSSLGIHSKETLGYIVISLADVINNKRINEKYHLIDSKNGRIQLELQWRTS